eukprot:gene16871-20043_t
MARKNLESMSLIELRFGASFTINAYVVDSDVPPGEPSNGAAFNAETMRRHFKQFRAMLAEYYELRTEFDIDSPRIVLNEKMRPRESDPEYGDLLKSIAARFLRKIVHGRSVVVAVLGTSVISGQDNCFETAYPPMLARAFEPFFKAMGQNGDGPNKIDEIMCAKDIVGDDVDILQTGYMMTEVPPAKDYEAFLRRSLSEGMLVHSIDGLGFMHGEEKKALANEYYK